MSKLKPIEVEIEKIKLEHSLAIGNDVVYLPDFIKTFNESFKIRVFTQKEIQYCEQFSNSVLRFASTWAAKEASYKALKQIDASFPFWWKDIEIERDETSGIPSVLFTKASVPMKIQISISHDGEYVWAMAFIREI